MSRWDCDYCVFEQGASGEVEVGAGYVSEDSFKFGEYNGLQEDGAYAIGNARARYRDEGGDYFDLRARDLGLDSRSLDVEGGRQGRYRVFLQYDEIPHYVSDSARTPYSGNNALSLPAGWVNAGSTAGMTGLSAALHDVDLKTQRKRLGLGLAVNPSRKWETGISFRHERRDGRKAAAGSFFFNAAQLVEPIDYETDELEVSATYTTRKWQSRLAYYGSFFDNDEQSLYWRNAYNPIVAGADAGRRALPPDNQFHQVRLSSAYRLTDSTRLSGDIALGRMEQDESLLAATENPNLATALPRSSAKAKVDTLTADLKVDVAATRKLRLNASWRYNDRDNKTPSDLFGWVTTDAFAAPSRRNLPYSFTDTTAGFGADYRFNRIVRASGGFDYARKERTHQEVDETRENTFWAKLDLDVRDSFDLTLKAAHADRSTSGYDPVAEIVPAENPLLRKFNMANRDRDTVGFRAGFLPHERVTVGLGADFSKDDYSKSAVGLTESRETDVNLDTSVVLTDASSAHVFAGRQTIKSEQAGSQAFANPDWSARNDDTVDSFGIGVRHQLIENRLDVGADYVMSRSTGEVKVNTGAPDPDFPDLTTDLDSVKLYADYLLKKNLTLHAAYWYESYHSKDWMLDGVAPGTTANVISFGQESPDYSVHALMLSLRYGF
jgi:MtrB/PioB family decaheme-associated outer membrane protein